MKKVFLALAIMALATVSCRKVETTETTAVDSTSVKVDSVADCRDSVSVDTTEVK